jgi:archaellum component FlaF (FlaF/FlaG flagellin family)
VEVQDPAAGGSNGNLTGNEPARAAVLAPPPPAPPPALWYPPPSTPPAAAAPKPRRTGLLLLVIILIVVLILAALGGGAVLANASLSSTYSPERAVTDYLAAQKRGDVNFMVANANYLRGDGSYSQYFDGFGVRAMMEYPQNTDIKDVRVASATVVDSDTRTINVTMTWNGSHVVRAFTVHKDLTRVHYSFYYSWRIDIPSVSIHVNAPNQAGSIDVDGLTLPQGATRDIQVIQGYHKVTMAGTGLYDSASAEANGIVGNPTVTFAGKLSSTAVAAAVTAIKQVFADTKCNTTTYDTCLNHTYYAPNQLYIWYFNLPGYGEVNYTRYVYTLTSDPTVGMSLVVQSDYGKVSASGVCAYTMTVDGSRHYYFKGPWSGTLTMSAGSFGWDITSNCLKGKA